MPLLFCGSTDPKHREKVIRVMQVMTAGVDGQLCKRDQTAIESCLISDPHEDVGVHVQHKSDTEILILLCLYELLYQLK